MKKIQIITSLGVIVALLTIFGGPLQIAQAAALTALSDTMSTLKVSTLANHTIKFTTPTGITAGQTITVTFPAGWTMGSVAFGDMDLQFGATDQALAATASGATWGAAVAGQVITFTSGTGAAAASTVVTIKIGTNATFGGTGVNQITNSATAGNATIAIGGTMADSGNILVNLLTNDQVAVSATVGQTLSFSLSANTLALGTLSVSAVTSGSHTMSLATNGSSGMVVTYSGATLTSGANTITAMSTAAASSVGTSQFGINAKLNTTPAVGAECSGTAPIAAAATGYATVNSYKFVSGETVVSAANAINTTTCTVSYIANIAGTTPAGSYSSTLTYTATATF